MENLTNGREKRLRLSTHEAIKCFREISKASDPTEREKAAINLSLRLNLPLTIDILREIFGSHKEMAIIAGVSHARTVREWSTGISRPYSIKVGEQFRLALRLSAIIYDRENPNKVKEWFSGPNPDLNNKAPLELLSENNARGVTGSSEKLVLAAKEFQRNQVLWKQLVL